MKKSYEDLMYLLNESNPYKILGVEESAELDSINRVYRELAKNYHPDLFQNICSSEHKKIETLFQKITYAYNLLKDPKERKNVDAKLNWQRETSTNSTDKTVSHPHSPFVLTGFSKSEKKSGESKKEIELKLFENAQKCIDARNYDEAIIILKNLIDMNPQMAHYHSFLGLAMKGRGWEGYSQAEFKVALYFDSQDPLALKYYIGNAAKYEQEKNPDKNLKKRFFQKVFKKN